MSLAQGFTNGFQLVDNYQRNNTREEMQKKQFGLQEENQAMRKTAFDSGEKLKSEQLTSAKNTNALNAKKAGHYEENRQRGINVQDAQISSANASQNASEYGLERTKASDKNAKLLKRAESYFINKDMNGFMNDKAFKDTDLSLLQTPEGIKSAKNLSKLITEGNMSGAMVEFNTLYKAKLNRNVGKAKGRDGGTIRDISPLNIEQSNGGYKLAIRVTTDKGAYQSYLSEERGIDKDDPDKQFTLDDLLGRASALGSMASIMDSSGMSSEMQGKLGQKLGAGAKDNRTGKQKEWDQIGDEFGPEARKQSMLGNTSTKELTLKDAMTLVLKNPKTMNLPIEQQRAKAIELINGAGGAGNAGEEAFLKKMDALNAQMGQTD
tara:strand:- start:153219 stop:154355 length:1137 start_codon:yes stop_codon:yes gene_type:complete